MGVTKSIKNGLSNVHESVVKTINTTQTSLDSIKSGFNKLSTENKESFEKMRRENEDNPLRNKISTDIEDVVANLKDGYKKI